MIFDAETVLFQPRERLSDSKGYQETGTHFSHDRLIYQHGFPERCERWDSHLRYNSPSVILSNLTSYREDYSEEQESGVVLLDKGRAPVLLGLLHTCWQNSAAGREYTEWIEGDKETFWFDLELCRVPYYFAKQYGIGLGTLSEGNTICGNALAHLDAADRLLWFNGGLLENKHHDKKNLGILITTFLMDIGCHKTVPSA